MAKATKVIHKQEVDAAKEHEREIRNLEAMLVEHKDGLYDLFEVMDKLRDHEVFNMIKGGLGQSETILYEVLNALNDSGTPQSMKNALLMFDLLGQLNMSELEPIVLKVNHGIEKVADMEFKDERPGYPGLIRALKDPEVVDGLNILLTLTKSLGQDDDPEMKLSPLSTDSGGLSPDKKRSSNNDESRSSSSKWLAVGVGVGFSALAVPAMLLLSRR